MIDLTSGELAYLWMSYQYETMSENAGISSFKHQRWNK